MNKQIAAYTRNAGLLLNGIGIGLIISASEWFQSFETWSQPGVGLLILLAGNFLRIAKTEEEKEKETRKKRERYERIKDRFGVERVLLARKASGVGTLFFFCIAMIIMFSGSMNFVWPLIFLIGLCMTTLVLTSAPDGQPN